MASFQKNLSAVASAVCWLALAYGQFGAYQAKVTELESRSFWLNPFSFRAGQEQCGLNAYQEGFLDAYRQDSQSTAYAHGHLATVLFIMANALVQYAFIHPLKPLNGFSPYARAVSLCDRTFLLSAVVLSAFYHAEVVGIAHQSLERSMLASNFFSGGLRSFTLTAMAAYSVAKMAFSNHPDIPPMTAQGMINSLHTEVSAPAA